MTLTIDHRDPLDDDEPRQSVRAVFLTALLVIICLVASAFGWGMYARLDAAVTSSGVIFAESERKSVQHLEGGILERLLVAPGERVAAGQIVATLDATQTRELVAQLDAERRALAFAAWRLAAEENDEVRLDPSLAPDAPAEWREDLIAAEMREFDARRLAHLGQIESLRRQIDQLAATIAASEGQARASERQIDLWREERTLAERLVSQGATPRQRLLEFDRTIAMHEGMRDEYRNLVLAAREDIARAEVEIATLGHQRRAEAAAERAAARRETANLESRLRAAADVLERHNLRAPQAGVVVDIRTVTPGAVIPSGETVMEIVPEGDRLMALAQLPTDAVDTVHVGRKVRIRLTAYRRALAPTVDGEVVYVSADQLENERDGSAYFEARISIDPESLARYPDVTLSPGMPVEVAIQIGERRAGDYLLEPFLRNFRGAMREE